MLSSLFSFFSGVVGKALIIGSICLAFFVLKMRLDITKSELEKSKLEISTLQNANKKQYEAIKTLLENQQKQNKIITEYEQVRKNAEKSFFEQQNKLKTISDKNSNLWKKEILPENIRLILIKD